MKIEEESTVLISGVMDVEPLTYPGGVSDEENGLFSSNSEVGYIAVETTPDWIGPRVPLQLTAGGEKKEKQQT